MRIGQQILPANIASYSYVNTKHIPGFHKFSSYSTSSCSLTDPQQSYFFSTERHCLLHGHLSPDDNTPRTPKLFSRPSFKFLPPTFRDGELQRNRNRFCRRQSRVRRPRRRQWQHDTTPDTRTRRSSCTASYGCCIHNHHRGVSPFDSWRCLSLRTRPLNFLQAFLHFPSWYCPALTLRQSGLLYLRF